MYYDYFKKQSKIKIKTLPCLRLHHYLTTGNNAEEAKMQTERFTSYQHAEYEYPTYTI